MMDIRTRPLRSGHSSCPRLLCFLCFLDFDVSSLPAFREDHPRGTQGSSPNAGRELSSEQENVKSDAISVVDSTGNLRSAVEADLDSPPVDHVPDEGLEPCDPDRRFFEGVQAEEAEGEACLRDKALKSTKAPMGNEGGEEGGGGEGGGPPSAEGTTATTSAAPATETTTAPAAMRPRVVVKKTSTPKPTDRPSLDLELFFHPPPGTDPPASSSTTSPP